MKKNDLPWGGMFLLKINLDNECIWVHSVFQTFLHLKYFQSTPIKMTENNSIIRVHIILWLGSMFVIIGNSKYNIHLASIIQPCPLFALDFGRVVCWTTFRPWRKSVLQRMLILPRKKLWSMTLPNRDWTLWFGIIFLLFSPLFFFPQMKISLLEGYCLKLRLGIYFFWFYHVPLYFCGTSPRYMDHPVVLSQLSK